MISGGTGVSSDSITITLPSEDYNISAWTLASDIGTITLTGGTTTNNYTINDTIVFDNFNWGDAQEFVDAFPDWQRVQDMCKKYPGLEIALRNFQTIYTLVKDDYDNPKDEK